jgi:hypothetical protein
VVAGVAALGVLPCDRVAQAVSAIETPSAALTSPPSTSVSPGRAARQEDRGASRVGRHPVATPRTQAFRHSLRRHRDTGATARHDLQTYLRRARPERRRVSGQIPGEVLPYLPADLGCVEQKRQAALGESVDRYKAGIDGDFRFVIFKGTAALVHGSAHTTLRTAEQRPSNCPHGSPRPRRPL